METGTLRKPVYSIRITISLAGEPQIVDETVYWRYGLSMDAMLRWRWYFEYLAARLKVAHPRRTVRIDILNITDDTDNRGGSLCGEDFVRWALPRRLAAKRRELGKYTKAFPQDLFGLKDAENADKAAKIRKQIADLENGIFDAYVPPVYINKLKKYLKQEPNNRQS